MSGTRPETVWASKPADGFQRRANEPAPVQEKGWTNGVLWAARTFDKSVWQPTRLAMAARVMGPDSYTFSVSPGQPVTVAVAVRSWFETTQPLENAGRRIERFADDDVRLLRQMHQRWWRGYGKGGVELGDAAIEQAYYRSLYVFASLSRDPEFPTNFYGVVTVDAPLWYADYKLDLTNAPVGRGAWNNNNGGAFSTAAAVRVGYDPEEIWNLSVKHVWRPASPVASSGKASKTRCSIPPCSAR